MVQPIMHFNPWKIFTGESILKQSTRFDLEKRFTQQNFFVRSVEVLLIDSTNGKPVSLPEKMVKMYEREVDMQKLKLQLQLLQDACVLR